MGCMQRGGAAISHDDVVLPCRAASPRHASILNTDDDLLRCRPSTTIASKHRSVAALRRRYDDVGHRRPVGASASTGRRGGADTKKGLPAGLERSRAQRGAALASVAPVKRMRRSRRCAAQILWQFAATHCRAYTTLISTPWAAMVSTADISFPRSVEKDIDCTARDIY